MAIKVLHPQSVSDVSLGALISECKLLLKLRHPHVVMTLGFATDGKSQHGMLMEPHFLHLLEQNYNNHVTTLQSKHYPQQVW